MAGTYAPFTTVAICASVCRLASFAPSALSAGSALPQIALAFATNSALVIAAVGVDLVLLPLPPQPATPRPTTSMPAITIPPSRPDQGIPLLATVGSGRNSLIIRLLQCC